MILRLDQLRTSIEGLNDVYPRRSARRRSPVAYCSGPRDRPRAYASIPEVGPLTEDGALQEAQLLDVRFGALRSTAGLLFELKSALLVARGQHRRAYPSRSVGLDMDVGSTTDRADGVDPWMGRLLLPSMTPARHQLLAR